MQLLSDDEVFIQPIKTWKENQLSDWFVYFKRPTQRSDPKTLHLLDSIIKKSIVSCHDKGKSMFSFIWFIVERAGTHMIKTTKILLCNRDKTDREQLPVLILFLYINRQV